MKNSILKANHAKMVLLISCVLSTVEGTPAAAMQQSEDSGVNASSVRCPQNKDTAISGNNKNQKKLKHCIISGEEPSYFKNSIFRDPPSSPPALPFAVTVQ